MPAKLRPLTRDQVAQRLAASAPRGRSSAGGELIDEFLASGEGAAAATFGSAKERNAVSISAANFVRRSGHQVWIKKEGGGTGTELTLINLAKSDAATKKAYENRPRVGRKPRN